MPTTFSKVLCRYMFLILSAQGFVIVAYIKTTFYTERLFFMYPGLLCCRLLHVQHLYCMGFNTRINAYVYFINNGKVN
jgi:hypothetical protein